LQSFSVLLPLIRIRIAKGFKLNKKLTLFIKNLWIYVSFDDGVNTTESLENRELEKNGKGGKMGLLENF
jgi:hypothetical protein